VQEKCRISAGQAERTPVAVAGGLGFQGLGFRVLG